MSALDTFEASCPRGTQVSAVHGLAAALVSVRAAHDRGPLIPIEFEPLPHTYSVNGEPTPGVTTILQEIEPPSPYFTDHHRDRGTFVHQACEFDDDGGVDDATLDPVIRPHLEAWRRFKKEHRVVVLAIELMVASLIHGFAGRFDRIIWFEGALWLIDLKSGQPSKLTAGPQTSAYQVGYLETFGLWIPNRAALWLKRDGTYAFTPHRDENDFTRFNQALVQLKGKA
ncbi:MAG: PD-(D/E)XK nuclease family protein [Thermoanaerobaculia bacterium]